MVVNHNNLEGASTEVSRTIKASRGAVYQAFLDPNAIASWLPPGTMTCQVHFFEPHEGGRFHLSLTYKDLKDSPGSRGGKSSEDTDTVRGRFVELVPNEKIVWLTEFESQEPGFAGEMRITTSLIKTSDGTKVTMLCENIPNGIRPEDNEEGTRSSLKKLAALLE